MERTFVSHIIIFELLAFQHNWFLIKLLLLAQPTLRSLSFLNFFLYSVLCALCSIVVATCHTFTSESRALFQYLPVRFCMCIAALHCLLFVGIVSSLLKNNLLFLSHLRFAKYWLKVFLFVHVIKEKPEKENI